MKKTIIFFNILLCISFYNLLYADEPTAKQFSTACFATVDYLTNTNEKTDPCREAIFGLGFITGFREALIASAVFNNDNQNIGKETLCIPPEVPTGELMIVVANWLKKHPERLDNIALAEIVMALNEAFPCSKD